MAAAATLSSADDTGPNPQTSQFEFFERRIRPVLVEHCYPCHGGETEKPKAGLRLDSRESILLGGDSGPAAVGGDPEKSLLVRAIRYTDPDLRMPPKKGKLAEQKIQDLIAWVQQGLPWPGDSKPVQANTQRAFSLSAADREYWAYQPVRRPPIPAVQRQDWVFNPIDAFVLAELERKGIQPNPPASRRELIRRLSFDLLGIPPTPTEVERFENDVSTDGYAKLVDRLLARPEYGERWGRHWLDVARFAQSNGYERDGEKPLAWRYRDYVIKAFNDDKPYDRFVLEQIAGDELPDATADSVVATGFQRLGVWDDEPDDKAMAEYDELDDIVSTTGSTILGLTLGCARCHDHKFDPISQADYYRFLAFFRNVRPSESPRYALDSANYLPLSPPAEIEKWEQARVRRMQTLESQIGCAIEGPGKRALAIELEKVKAENWPGPWALGVRERTGEPLTTRILIRGNPNMPGPEVEPGFLTALGGGKPLLPSPAPGSGASGRRLALARWITSTENPLTARVAVNRVWQHHFGQGIVKTGSDFGHAGVPPSHPQLLDWLASEFMRSGWSLKNLHRLIVLSRTYQASSRSDNELAHLADPDDNLLWRQRLRRLEAENLWDTVLAVTGELNPVMGGRGFFPYLNGEVLAGESRPGLDWELSSRAEQSRRSVYVYIRRTMLAPLLEAFDYNNTSSVLPERPVTTVAPQALMLLNSDWARERARAFAARIHADADGKRDGQIARAYRLAFGREPSASECRGAQDFLHRQADGFTKIHSRLTFSPDVPNALFADYLKQLESAHFLRGPSSGWSYYRGRWSGAYEGIRAMDRMRGPFALWQGQSFEDGVVDAEITLHAACESGSILLRSGVKDEEQRGYEIQFDPRRQRVSLVRHGKELTLLGEGPAPIPSARAFPVRIGLKGPQVRVWLSSLEQPLLDVVDSEPVMGAGRLGVRSMGAAMSLDHLQLAAQGQTTVPVWKSEPTSTSSCSANDSLDDAWAEQRAWESFCLLLMNLNEFVYVD